MIKEQLKALSIKALKEGDKGTRAWLGGILSEFLSEEKSKGFSGFTEESERKLVARYVKQLEGALEQMGDRPIAADYRAEIELLRPFLPQLLDEATTRELVAPLAEQAGSLGQFMGLVMKEHKGKVDPKIVRAVGQELGLS